MAPKVVNLILLLLLVIGASIDLLGCDFSQVNALSQSTLQSTQEILQTNPRGIRAALIHRDHVSSPSSAHATDRHWSPTEKLHDNARRSIKRARSLSKGRARRQLAENAPSSSPGGQPVDWESGLNDASDDEYLMEISLGTPPQKFVAVADTGSDLTWLQCLPCKPCFKQSQSPFDPSLSSTYATLSCSSSACEFLNQSSTCPYVSHASGSVSNSTNCSYTYYYADGSQTAGTLAEETITMEILEGNDVQQVPNFWFGCSHMSTTTSGLFDKANGLVGLGQGPISFPSQLGKYFGNKFSYCLVNRSDSIVLESPLIFGDAAVPETIANGFQLQFTPLITNPVDPGSTFYYVDIENVSVNGVAVAIRRDAFAIAKGGSGGSIFDSGTTYSSLVTAAFDPLVAAISAAITTYSVVNNGDPYFELCYKAKWEKWASEYGQQVPKLSFKFNNATAFELGVEGSWIEYNTEHVCLAILRSTPSLVANIFGNVQQVNYQILYDLELKQIGFLPANCSQFGRVLSSTSGSPSSQGPVLSAGISILAMLLSTILLLTS